MDKYARRLCVDLYTGPQAEQADLEICRLADGSPWVLGSGACGIVYKVRFVIIVHVVIMAAAVVLFLFLFLFLFLLLLLL